MPNCSLCSLSYFTHGNTTAFFCLYCSSGPVSDSPSELLFWPCRWRESETAVTGTRSCYCVHFRVKLLYSNCSVPKRARVCVVLAAFFDVVLTGVWTAMFCACQIIFANAILAWPPPFYMAHARLRVIHSIFIWSGFRETLKWLQIESISATP